MNETMGPEKGKITVVSDNISLRGDLEPDWGFSCMLDLPQGCILFDTGSNSRILLENMARLGLEPLKIEHVILSHFHDDHIGGLPGLLALGGGPRVYIPASFPSQLGAFVESYGVSCERIEEGRTIFSGVHTTGEMGEAIREQALVAETSAGLIVVTGCAHPGIVEMVERVTDRFRMGIRLLIGGFHLMDRNPSALRAISKRLESLGVELIAPCHCTGDSAKTIIHNHFGNRCLLCGAGLESGL